MIKRTACAAVLAATFTAAGCGQQDASTTETAATPKADAASAMSMRSMTSLASTTEGDVKVGLEATAPETFFVDVGGTERKHAPTAEDNAHMMVTLADAKSGIRLPDASVTLRLTGPNGKRVFDGPLYPMIGRGMGMHYGENVPLGETGTYTAQLVAGPPRIGRHRDAQGAWEKTVRLEQKLRWDGKAVSGTT